MTVRELINLGADELKDISDTARLDSALLLSHILKVDRAKLMALYPEIVDSKSKSDFLNLISTRKEGYPISYIFGEKEFYGRVFHVEDGVLTPRPDTEVLIERTLELIDSAGSAISILDDISILDLCTGTGCIAITLKSERPHIKMTATDISPIAEKVFTINNSRLTKNQVNFIKSDLYKEIDGKFDIIVSNPPYLTTDETRDRINDKWKEPELALDGGNDGLDLIRIIIDEVHNYLNSKGWLLIEASPWQMPIMEDLLQQRGFTNIEILKDIAGFERVIIGKYE